MKLKDKLIDHFGIKFDVLSIGNPVNPTINVSNMYLLTNTEFKFDANLIGFELYSSQEGNCTIEV